MLLTFNKCKHFKHLNVSLKILFLFSDVFEHIEIMDNFLRKPKRGDRKTRGELSWRPDTWCVNVEQLIEGRSRQLTLEQLSGNLMRSECLHFFEHRLRKLFHCPFQLTFGK
jgi:hypothetical protein